MTQCRDQNMTIAAYIFIQGTWIYWVASLSASISVAWKNSWIDHGNSFVIVVLGSKKSNASIEDIFETI